MTTTSPTNGADYSKKNEGLVLWPYDDADPQHLEVKDIAKIRGTLTQGRGHTGPDIVVGVHWTEPQADAVFDRDYTIACHGAAMDIGRMAWERLDLVRIAMLADMCFEMGEVRLLGFERMIIAIRAFNWEVVAAECLASKYGAKETKRAHRSAWGLHFGLWPGADMW